ncbi:unnamed protein product, partial [Amoebophrya sp. A120]
WWDEKKTNPDYSSHSKKVGGAVPAWSASAWSESENHNWELARGANGETYRDDKDNRSWGKAQGDEDEVDAKWNAGTGTASSSSSARDWYWKGNGISSTTH